MKLRSKAVAFCLVAAILSSPIAAADYFAMRQATIRNLLTKDRMVQIRKMRLACATGVMADDIMTLRTEGNGDGLPNVADLCVAVLTRLAREKALRPVSDTLRAGSGAGEFDAGFVHGFKKRKPLAREMESISQMLPLAERCLAMRVIETEDCWWAGHVIGTRVARGEMASTR